MVKEKVTFFAGVPTMYWGLLGALDDSGVDVAEIAANLRVAAAGGSALPVEVHKEFEKTFGVTILEGYGLSETSPVASFSPYGEEVRVGSIGVPDPRGRDEADQTPSRADVGPTATTRSARSRSRAPTS